MHVHIAGPGDRYPDDLSWHERFRTGVGFKGLKVLKGWGCKKVTDQMMINTLLKQTRKMKEVDYAVVLAFDHAYDVEGNRMGPENGDCSTLYVSNDFVDRLCKHNRNLLLGLSVHPFRNDAVKELKKYEKQAVLCKWMASAQVIDFEDSGGMEKLELFYETLVELKIPLLFHTGVETSIPSCDPERYDKFNSPMYIRAALERGVTVILAHCGCSYFDYFKPQPDPMRDEVMDLFIEMNEKGKDWHLYADVSALFSPFRKWEKIEELGRVIPTDRLIYGSDFPNPAKGRREFFLRWILRYKKANLIDRYCHIAKKWLPEYFSNGATILHNFNHLLSRLGRWNIVVHKEQQKAEWLGGEAGDLFSFPGNGGD
jgi:predicted TIM-barrel fold metal-dependent hydrolase